MKLTRPFIRAKSELDLNLLELDFFILGLRLRNNILLLTLPLVEFMEGSDGEVGICKDWKLISHQSPSNWTICRSTVPYLELYNVFVCQGGSIQSFFGDFLRFDDVSKAAYNKYNFN